MGAQYGSSTLPQSSVYEWLKKFKNGRTSVRHDSAEKLYSEQFFIHVWHLCNLSWTFLVTHKHSFAAVYCFHIAPQFFDKF